MIWVFGLLSMGLLYLVVRKNLVFFFIRRMFTALITLFLIATLTFALLRLLPGGPFDDETPLPPVLKANIEKRYGLALPLLEQYTRYLKNIINGELGYSYNSEGRAVSEVIASALPVSMQLGGYALLVAFIFGIPVGVIAAARRGSVFDRIAMLAVTSGISLPSFLLAPLLIYVFSFGWPLNQLAPELQHWLVNHKLLLPPALWHSPQHYILPVVTLGIRPAAFIARLTRASVLDVIHGDYVRTARAKGLSERRVLFQHVLRNSIGPVLSYAGPLVAGVLSGSFVVEVIFAVPGIAKHFVQSVVTRDYPLIMALTMVFSLLLIFANLLVDVFYQVVDPRLQGD